MKQMLVHVCCVPDLLAASKILANEDLKVYVYFYNPNIDDSNEYLLRKSQLKKIPLEYGFEEIQSLYDPSRYLTFVSENIAGMDRCQKCIYMRLEKTFETAAENGFLHVTTTLTASPRKEQEFIRRIGEAMAVRYRVAFDFYNFRSDNGISFGADLCRRFGIYRQTFCGCSFSKKESEELHILSQKNRFKELSEIVGELKAENLFRFNGSAEIRIPYDICLEDIKEDPMKILKSLRPKSIVINSSEAKEIGITKSGRINIGNWRAKFIVV